MSETLTPDQQAVLGPVRDPERLGAVRATGLLDTPPEEAFDALTRLAARLLGVPAAFLSLVDEHRDFYKSCYGFAEPLASERQLEGTTFCHYAIASDRPLVIPDTRADPVFREVPTVESLGVAAYLGIPLVVDGQVVGSLCAIDLQPREWSAEEVAVMRELAASAVREMELRLALRRAEEQAEELRRVQHYHDLVESLDAIVWEMDVSTWRFTYVSPQAEEMLGYPLERWYREDGFWAERLVHPGDRGWAVPFCVDATREARDHEFDYRAVAADGRVVWLRDVVRVLRDDGGRATLLRGVMTDVTEQKLSEEALREREAQLAEAQRLAHVGSWEWDPASGRVTWSDEMYRIYGLEPQSEQCSFQSYLARVIPEDREHVQARIRHALETGEPFDFEERIARPDGSVRVLRSRGMVVPDPGGEGVPRLVGTCQDVTDQRRLADREVELARTQAARDWAERAERRAAFLAEAGKVLSSSLDPAATLRALAHQAVPQMADWCAVDVLEEGEIRRVVTAHSDPAKEALAMELARRYPSDPDAPVGAPAVLRTGEPELVPEIPEELLDRAARDEEHRRILRELGLRSYMVVPLLARGRTLGALTFAAAESGRRYGEDDLRLAQELAHRAAVAVDNARLYRLAEEARQQTDRLLESITDAFFALDADWRFTYVNPEAERVLRRPAAELLGRSIWEEFPEAVGSTFEQAYRRAAERRQTVQFEEFYPPLDTWFEVRAYPSPEGLSVFFRDVNERHQAEEEVRNSEERFRSLVEATASIVWCTPASGEFETPQPEWTRFTGQSYEEARGWGWLDAVHPGDRAQTASLWKRATRDWAVFEAEQRLRRHDGEYRHMQVRAVPIVGADGEIREWVGVHTDVTEQKRAEQALRESEERFRVLSDMIPQHIWITRPDGYHEYYNRRWYEYTGTTPERARGAGWADLLHPDDLERATARWQHSLRTGEPYSIEYRFRRHDGAFRWFLGQAMPLRGPDGEIVRWFGTLTDIQDQKEAEAERERLISALEAERRRLANVFHNAPAAIAVTRGPEHEFVSANPVYGRLVGREVVGHSIRAAFPELEGQGFFELMDQVYASGEAYVGNETPARFDRDGDGALEDGYFNFVYQPLLGPGGTISGVMTFAVEVTDQVRARQEVEAKAAELSRLARALEVSNRELDQFAYVASHDLKAPLRGIANLSQWIEEDLEGEISTEVREHLELLRGRVHRMEGLIDGILQYSRAGRVREKPEAVEVGTLVREVVDLISPPEGVEVRAGEGLPTLLTERLPLQQVFMNLIGNAVKYNRAPQPWVEVSAREEGDFFRFSVADNGPGIAPEYHERIFGIFQTLQARDEVEGTGIGLSLVKKLVENRGGRVWVESEEGAGSTFHFLWPRQSKGEADA